MAGTYDEETKRRLENRKRNAEFRKAEQIRRRNNYLLAICGIIVVLIFIIIIAKSCSSDNESQKAVSTTKEAATVQTTVEETTTEEIVYKKTTDRVNFREKKDTDEDSIIETLAKGVEVEVLDDSDDTWCEIRYDGKTGYVSKDYLKD